MQKKTLIQDKDFGQIVFVLRRNARCVTLRVKPDGLYVTVPVGADSRRVFTIIEENRERLKEVYRKACTVVGPDYVLEATRFSVHLQPGRTAGRYVAKREGIGRWCLEYPPQTEFTRPEVQEQLKGLIGKALYASAKAYLPQRLDELARKHGFSYVSVRITSARTRWGSCSSRRSVSLSCYLMLLPDRLIDYVLLHELVHTQEMNHGPAFWQLLDRAAGGDSRRLRAELSAYRPGI